MLPSILDSIIPKRRDPQDDDPLNVAPQATDNSADGGVPISAPDPNIQGTDALIPHPYESPDSASQAYNVAPQATSAASAAVSKASTPPDSTPPDSTPSSPYNIAPMAMSSVTATPPSLQNTDAITPRPYTPMPDGGPIDPLSASGGADQSPKITPQVIPAGIDAAPMAEAPTMAMHPSHPEDETDPYVRRERLIKEGASKNGFWKRLGEGALRGFGSGNILGGVAEGIAEGVSPGLNTRLKTSRYLRKSDNQIAEDQGIRKFGTDQDYRKAQTANIYSDNEQAKENSDSLKAYRDATLAEREQMNKDRQQGLALNRLTKLKYFDPENSAHKQLATQAGIDPEELKGWDDRNPLTKKVGGQTYQYNRDTKSYDPTDLPIDESQSLTGYDVKMPNGETRTYQVSQKDAAKFAQQMNVVGAQIQSREKIAGDNRDSRESIAADNNKSRQTISDNNNQVKGQLQADRAKYGQAGVLQRAQDAFVKEYQKANKNKMPSPQQIQDHLNNNVLPLLGN